jgi:short-subunit dehydrogenase
MNHPCAIITGAGEGLGRSFAMCCAARGYNLILISLPGSRLEQLAHLIEYHYRVKVWYLEENLCEKQDMDVVLAFISNHSSPIQLLINNAGMGHTCRFDELSAAYINLQLDLNIKVLTKLTHHLIPVMRAAGGGKVINIGSMAGFYSLPLKNSYAASKAYVLGLSLALQMELAPMGIGVSVVCPNGIISNIHQFMVYRQCGWMAKWCFMHPDTVAEYAMEKSLRGQSIIIPGRINRIIHFFNSFI